VTNTPFRSVINAIWNSTLMGTNASGGPSGVSTPSYGPATVTAPTTPPPSNGAVYSHTQTHGSIAQIPFNAQSQAYQNAIQQMAAAAKQYQQSQMLNVYHHHGPVTNSTSPTSPQQLSSTLSSFRGVADMYRTIEIIRGGPLTAFQREQVNWFWNNHNRFPLVQKVIERIRGGFQHQHDTCSDMVRIEYSYGNGRKSRLLPADVLIDHASGGPGSWLPFMLYVSEKLDNPSRPRPSRAVMAPPEADKLCKAIKPLYRGEPSRAAMYLLRGTLMAVAPDKIKGPNRVEMNCRWPLNLMSAGYMRQAKDHRNGFTTKAKGIELMETWAKKNKVFRKFFEAYVPAGAHDRAIEHEVLEALKLDD